MADVKQEINISEIAEFLKPYREVIAAEWAELLLQELPFSEYSPELGEKLSRDTLVWVDALFQTMTQIRSGERASSWSGKLSQDHFFGESYNLADFFAAWRLIALRVIKNLPLPELWPSLPAMHAPQLGTVIHEVYTSAKNHEAPDGKQYVTKAMNKMEILRGRTALLLEATRAASSSLHLDEVLTTAGRGIATATGVQGCLFYLVDEEENLVPLPGYLELDAIVACDAVQLEGKFCPALDALVEILIENVRMQMIPLDYDIDQFDLNICNIDEPGKVKSLLAVPCSFEGHLEAIAIACAFGETHNFTVEETELAWGIANVIAPAIANARLHEKTQSLAAREERVRLAQEMHDTLAQVLTTISLKVETAMDQLDDDQVEQSKENLGDVQEMAGDAFTMVREEIFSLRAFDSLDSRWLPTLQEYFEDYQLYYGLEINLDIQDTLADELSDTTSAQVFRIIQEALTNIRRHANATQAWVSFYRKDHGICIEIKDDGVGFDLDHVMKKKGSHYGLAIMTERAESVGGRLILHTQPGQATRLEVWVPHRNTRGRV